MSNAIDFLPADPAPEQAIGDVEVGKHTTEHVEHVPINHNAADMDVKSADEGTRTGLRRLLRRNPSITFMREVAAANEFELDSHEVKRVSTDHLAFPMLPYLMTTQFERKLFWLIVPALSIGYAFYYIDKTTLAYAALFDIKKDLHLHGTDYSNLSSVFYM